MPDDWVGKGKQPPLCGVIALLMLAAVVAAVWAIVG